MTISHQGFVVGGGQHPGYCEAPGHHPSKPREFEGRAPGMDRCHACWYAEAMDEAAKDFSRLGQHLTAAGIPWSVDQTGGMVMCLRIDLPHRSGPDGETWWIWVSDLDELVAEGELWVGVHQSMQDEESDCDTRVFRYLDELDENDKPIVDESTWLNFSRWIVDITKEYR